MKRNKHRMPRYIQRYQKLQAGALCCVFAVIGICPLILTPLKWVSVALIAALLLVATRLLIRSMTIEDRHPEEAQRYHDGYYGR